MPFLTKEKKERTNLAITKASKLIQLLVSRNMSRMVAEICHCVAVTNGVSHLRTSTDPVEIEIHFG
jgi:hypothetical protein